MKISYLTPSVSRRAGGIFDAACRLAIEMQRTGAHVNAIGLKDIDTEKDLAAWRGVQVRAWRTHGPKAFGFAPDLLSDLCRSNVDLVHVHGLWMYPSVAVRRWAKQFRRAYVVSPHGMLDAWALKHSVLKKRIAGVLYENAHLQNAACIHALNDAEADAVRGYGLKNPVCVIPNGVEVPTTLCGRSPSWASAVPEGSKILLYLGRIHPKKGLVDLLHAWRVVADKGWQLVIAGWGQGNHDHQLRLVVRELGISNSVMLIGPQFDVDKEATLERADAVVLPSISEGLPMVVLEAWAHGLPVLMTRQCNLPEGSRAGAAIQVDANANSIAEGLRRLFAMAPEQRRLMGSHGRELVKQRFQWETVAQRMKEVYDWVLGNGTKPATVV